MPISPLALKTELQTDPVAVGYAAALAAGNHTALATLLNTVRAGAVDTWRSAVSADGLRSRVAKSEYAALSAADKQFVEFLLGGGTVDTTVTQVRTDLAALFPGGSVTRAAWIALAQYKPTRAEELFGEGTVADAATVGHALAS